METIEINYISNDKESLLIAIEALTNQHFTHYTAIHKMAKKDQKANPFNLRFQTAVNGNYEIAQPNADTDLLIKQLNTELAPRLQWKECETANSEIAFFAEACQHESLVPAIRQFMKRMISYNFGVYSPTMRYENLTPIGFWAAFFLAKHSIDELELFGEFVSSCRLPSQLSRRDMVNEQWKGFEHPAIMAACHNLYQHYGWNKETIQLLNLQMCHYHYIVPMHWAHFCEKYNPKEYLTDDKHLHEWLENFIQTQQAFIAEHDSHDVFVTIEEVLPEVMHPQQIENIKTCLNDTFA